MARLTSALVLLVAVSGGLYQIYVKPLLVKVGYWRVVEEISNKHCKTISDLQACEKIVLHQPTGLLYLACSTPQSRVAWTPALSRLNASGASPDDYLAFYDPASSRITRLKVKNFTSSRGLSLHGMDVVPSSVNPEELFVYLVNHRVPLAGQPAHLVGADSSIEIFKTIVGSDTLTHIKTVEDEVILTPNDVVGYPDGQNFYFTNDHGEKVGLLREFDILGRASTSVGYCHIKTGCKYAIQHMRGNNGIARAQNDTLYVSDVMNGGVSILERQRDDTLVIVDVIQTDRGVDNISIDSDGVLWAAGIPSVYTRMKHFANPSISAPSSAHRISINTGPASFYGEKYKVEKAFEDDGQVASGSTSVVHDAERGHLFLHGLSAPHLTVCKV